MHKIEVTLKQHTPLIHFQHDQEGATLRATEVKPKLDRFILTKLGEDPDYKSERDEIAKGMEEKFNQLNSYEKGKLIAKDLGWLIGKGEQPALDYKMKITSDSKRINGLELPMYFGNMGEENRDHPKYPVMCKECQMQLLSYNNELIKYIQDNASLLAEFFERTNFGTRQSEGYGSFYIDEKDKNYYFEPKTNLYFDLKASTHNELFGKINLFYCSLRGGLNIKKRVNNNKFIDKFYFKSLLFKYMKNKDIQWEKKTIKENFFPKSYDGVKGLREQQNKRKKGFSDIEKQDLPLFYSSEKKYIVKDLFGLSATESWKSYRTTIKKNQAKINSDGSFAYDVNNPKIYRVADEKETTFTRIKSPLFFKIIHLDGNNYRVYISIDKEIAELIKKNILGKWMIIDNGEKKQYHSNFPLQFPDSFDYEDFFKYIFSGGNFDIEKHIEQRFKNKPEYKILEKIYTQLKNNYQ